MEPHDQQKPLTGVQQEFEATLPPLQYDGAGSENIDPVDVEWKRVSPRYFKVRMVGRLIRLVIYVALVAAIFWVPPLLDWWESPSWLLWGAPGAMLLWQLWLTLLVGRQVKALGYSERAEHLLKAQGIMFREVRAIPYGRIQYVDVSSGPIESKLGLATVDIKTASSGSVSIPGLQKSEANQLREVLIDLSDAKMVGL